MKEIKTVSALEWLIVEAPVLFEDIYQLEQVPDKNPETQKQLNALKKEIRNACTSSFKECIQTGLFIPPINYETIVSIYIEEIKSLESRYRIAMIYPFLNGLCSEEGRKELIKIYSIINPREIK